MDVQVDSTLIKGERDRRAWSQQHLGQAAGLSLRTVQRIEATGIASYESARAIASCLEIPVSRIRIEAKQNVAQDDSSQAKSQSKRQIRVNSVPDKQIPFVKALRLVGRMGLKQAVDLAQHLREVPGSLLIVGIDQNVAEYVLELLQAAGAEAVMENCSVDTPMLCAPGGNKKYKWGPVHQIRKAS